MLIAIKINTPSDFNCSFQVIPLVNRRVGLIKDKDFFMYNFYASKEKIKRGKRSNIQIQLYENSSVEILL